MAANLVRVDSIPEKWRAFAQEVNTNVYGSDSKGNNAEWIDVNEAKALERKIREYYTVNGNGFDPIEGQVSNALTEIGINGALLENKLSKYWKNFTDGCEQILRGTYNFLASI